MKGVRARIIADIKTHFTGMKQSDSRESISWQEYSPEIISILDTILWIFRWRNENVLVMSSLTADILSKSLLELLEMSESNGPGLISIPDIINKMQRTMKKLRHLRTKMLLLVFTCNLCISGQQSDLFTLLVFFLVSAAFKRNALVLKMV